MWPVCAHKAESGVDLFTCCLPTRLLSHSTSTLTQHKTLSCHAAHFALYDTMQTTNKLTHDDYTVAWIAPLEVESIAARLMLDTTHEKLPQSPVDHNIYALGSISGYNIVIASLPTTGSTSAATVVTQLRNTFKQIRFGLLVGIGGGVPTQTDNGPIHLGDVVVSKPEQDHSGAI